ncbi:hypothetical protein FSP39_018905, partial [Pinctada imbricata]
IEVVRCRKGKSHMGRKYVGICFDTTIFHEVITLSNLCTFVEPDTVILETTGNVVRLGILTKTKCNGNIVIKEVMIDFNKNQWAHKVLGKEIDLKELEVDNSFPILTTKEYSVILKCVRSVDICIGLECPSAKFIPRYIVQEQITRQDGETERRIRCSTCKGVAGWLSENYACVRCRKSLNVFKNCDNNIIDLNLKDDQDLSRILDAIFPKAPPQMKAMLEAQYNALSVQDPRQRRWDSDMIKCCLNLWTRSPQSYKDLKDSNILILPSGRQLQRYKNATPQDTGINSEILHWMSKTADRQKVPKFGRYGGLIHDETRIQQDLVMNTKGNKNELVGWIDTGDEGQDIRILKEGTVQQTLATEVFQVYFLGYTGFRFPVAHYPTGGITAAEIYILLYDIISALQSWGFFVDYVLQDGGQQNREFIKMHFKNEEDAEKKNFCSVNIVNPEQKLAHSQDYSHNIKKLRNAVLSSGVNGTRAIKKGDHFIMWQQWLDAAKWDDDTNSRKLHYKITPSHLHPDSAEKMRNHLAEEMLDSDMLNLMQQYKQHLQNRPELNSAIEFLENTSKLITIFKDKRPIFSVKDTRVATLLQVREWFQTWKSDNQALGGSKKEKEKSLPSQKCLNDIDCLIGSFVEVVKVHVNRFPGEGIYPSRFNSDVIENNFCQVRGLHNGNMTNPNYQNYKTTMNSVILGQTSISRGRKSNAGQQSANPYPMEVKIPNTILKKRKPLTDVTNLANDNNVQFLPPSKKNCIWW